MTEASQSPCAICAYYHTNICMACRIPEQDRLPINNDPVQQGRNLKQVLSNLNKEKQDDDDQTG